MTLIKVQHDENNPYTIINRSAAEDCRLSWKAKGIWMYAFSRPTDWQFYKGDLIKRSIGGERSLDSGLKELEKNGYLYRFKKRNTKNQFDGLEWIFFETSKTKEEIQKMFPKPTFCRYREMSVSAKCTPILSNDYLDSNEEIKEGETPPLPAPEIKKSPKKEKIQDPKKTFGQHENVKLTESEFKSLCATIGDEAVVRLIESLDLYLGETGKVYKSHYYTILKWHKKESDPSAKKTSKQRSWENEYKKDEWKPKKENVIGDDDWWENQQKNGDKE